MNRIGAGVLVVACGLGSLLASCHRTAETKGHSSATGEKLAAQSAGPCPQGNFALCSAKCEAGDHESCKRLEKITGGGVASGGVRPVRVIPTPCERGDLVGCAGEPAQDPAAEPALSAPAEPEPAALEPTAAPEASAHVAEPAPPEPKPAEPEPAAAAEPAPTRVAIEPAPSAVSQSPPAPPREPADTTGPPSHTWNAAILRSPKRAAAFFGVACDEGYLLACARLGDLMENNVAVRRNQAASERLFRRACQGGSVEGCTGLGELYATGSGVGKDTKKAVELFRQACDGRDLAGNRGGS